MGIRGLDDYLNSRRLVQSAPLSCLSETRMGIDVTHYLRTLITAENTREPLVAATGGLPIALIAKVENDLRSLEKLHIKPVFVFPGLPVQRRPPPRAFQFKDGRDAHTRVSAWNLYENGMAEVAANVLAGGPNRGGWTNYRDVTRLVLRMFRHRMVEYIFAPYMAGAQLAYLQGHERAYIHSVWADLDMLAFPADRVITSVDFSASTFTFVDKLAIQKDAGLGQDSFLDFLILCGGELGGTFPPMGPEQFFDIPSLMSTVRHFKNGNAVLSNHPNQQLIRELSYYEHFNRTRAAIKFSFVLTAQEGACTPLPLALPNLSNPALTPADVPADLAEIFSHKFPDELYFHLSKGLISSQLLGWLSTGLIVETMPYDNGETNEYQRFIRDVITENLTAPRCTALGLLASCLHASWSQRRVGAVYYCDQMSGNPAYFPPPNIINFSGTSTKALIDRSTTWLVPGAIIDDELRRQVSSTIDFKLCLGATSEDDLARRTRRRESTKMKPLDKKDEVVANAIWRFMDLRGLSNPNHTQTNLGKALHASLLAAGINDKFQEPLYLALELSRAGVLHGDPWTNRSYSGGPSYGTETERISSLLFMRCLSLVPLIYRNQPWSGPLSRELLVFNSFVRALSRSLKHLFEAVCVHMLLKGDARRQRDDYVDIVLSLPFQTEVNTGFGILGKTYIDATLAFTEGGVAPGDVDKPETKAAKEEAMKVVEETFSSVKNPRAEVMRGFRFWDALMISVRSIAKGQGPSPQIQHIVMSESVIGQFEVADKWLKTLRP